MNDAHLPDSYLERYVTGLIHNDAEIAWVEAHLYRCPECAERMWAMQEHLDDPDSEAGSGSAETGQPDLYRRDGPVQ